MIANSIMPVKLLKTYWNKQPSGYVAGSVLQRIAKELDGRFKVAGRNGNSLRLIEKDGRFSCCVAERVEAHFMMHIVATQLTLDIPAPKNLDVILKINNSGWFRRTGIRCLAPRQKREEWADLCAAVEQDKNLQTALHALNFRTCQIRGTESGWQVLIEPFGGSEVVNRLPSFRRYLRLGHEQTDSLVLGLLSLNRILCQFNDKSQNR